MSTSYSVLPSTYHITVSPWDFEIHLTFEFDPGEPSTWEHPGYEPYAVIERAVVGGVDIYNMLTSDQLEQLEQYALRGMGL